MNISSPGPAQRSGALLDPGGPGLFALGPPLHPPPPPRLHAPPRRQETSRPQHRPQHSGEEAGRHRLPVPNNWSQVTQSKPEDTIWVEEILKL